jgi:hypothetical protein
MPVGCETVCALNVASAAPEQLLLLACCSPLASLLRCPLVTLGDLSAKIVEGRFGRRSSRARFFTRPFGLCTLLWHVCHSSSLVSKAGPLEECETRHSGGGGCFRLYSPGPMRRLRVGTAARHHVRSSVHREEELAMMRAGRPTAGGVYGESVAGSPPPDRSKRVIRSSISRSHLSRSTLPSQ